MRTETITWRELSVDGWPDVEITVLVEFIAEDGGHDTWPGWWSGEHWIDASTGDQIERDGRLRVVAWCDMPAGSGGA